MEEWREIPDTHGRYWVSDLGRVKSQNGRKKKCRSLDNIMLPKHQPTGYLCVDLFLNGRYHRWYIHRLVMAVFCGSRPGLEINHKNGIKTDNRLCNLEYCTKKENMEHCARMGLRKDIKKVAAIRDNQVVARGDFSRDLTEKLMAMHCVSGKKETIARSIRKFIDTNKPYQNMTFVRLKTCIDYPSEGEYGSY